MLIAPVIMVFLAAVISLYRIAQGPTNVDRVIGGDVFGVSMCLILILTSLVLGQVMILDVTIAYAILLFADVLLMAKFMERGAIHI